MERAFARAYISRKFIGTKAEMKVTGTYFDKDIRKKSLTMNKMMQISGRALPLIPGRTGYGPMSVLALENLI